MVPTDLGLRLWCIPVSTVLAVKDRTRRRLIRCVKIALTNRHALDFPNVSKVASGFSPCDQWMQAHRVCVRTARYYGIIYSRFAWQARAMYACSLSRRVHSYKQGVVTYINQCTAHSFALYHCCQSKARDRCCL